MFFFISNINFQVRILCMLSHFSCFQLCDPRNCSLPGSSVHGLLQARILEWIFTAALFTTARTWTQPRCPLADKWVRKLWYIYTVDYYSAIKNNAFESVLMRWTKLEPIIQSEVSPKEKHQYSILQCIQMEFRKMVMMTLYVRQQKRHRYKEQTFGLYGRRREWDNLRE